MEAGHPCGDACRVWQWDATTLLAIVDGLGHGTHAAQAAAGALEAIAQEQQAPLDRILAHTDRAIVDTRGAAIGLARVRGDRLEYAAVGNTRMMVLREGRTIRLPSEAGIVGGGLAHAASIARLDVAPGDWIVLCTDGIDEDFRIPAIFPEWDSDPAGLCRYLLATHRIVRDDAGVLVARV